MVFVRVPFQERAGVVDVSKQALPVLFIVVSLLLNRIVEDPLVLALQILIKETLRSVVGIEHSILVGSVEFLFQMQIDLV